MTIFNKGSLTNNCRTDATSVQESHTIYMARIEVYAVLLGCLLSLLVCDATYFRRPVYKAMLWRKHRPMTTPSRWNFSLHRGLYVKPHYTGHVRQYHGTIRNKWKSTHSRNIVKVRKHTSSIRFIDLCRHKFGRYSPSTIARFIKRNSHILPFVFKNTAPKYKQERKTWYILRYLCACYRNVCNSTDGGVASLTSTVSTTPQTLVAQRRVNTTSSTPRISSTSPKSFTITSTETPDKSVTSRKMASTTSRYSTRISSTSPKSSTITSTDTPDKSVTSRKMTSTTSRYSTPPKSSTITSTDTPVKPVTSRKITSYQSTSSATTTTKTVTSATTSAKHLTTTTATKPLSSTTKSITSASTNPFIPNVPDSV